MSAEAGEAFIYVGGRKQRATPAEVQRVRELECERNGHSYEAVLVYQSSDPKQFLCGRCGKSWQVAPTTKPCEDKPAGRCYLPSLLSDQLGISTSEARRIINQGGVKLDGEAVVDLDPPADRISGKTLKVGKKQEVRVP